MRILIKLLVCLSLFFVFAIQAFPHRFTRLIKVKPDGTIEKVVDFISDAHIPLPQPTKKTPQSVQKSVEPKQWEQLAIAERTLVESLQKLSKQQGEKIDLIWELSEQATSMPDEGQFLLYLGKKAAGEYARNKNKRVNFVFGDRYRNDSVGAEFANLFDPTWHEALKNKKMEALTAYIDAISRAIDNDFSLLVSAANRSGDISKINEHEVLRRYFNDYLFQINRLRNEFNLDVKPVRRISAFLRSLVGNNRYDEFLKRWRELIVDKVMDIELLLKIFSSDSQHIIVYAGGNHATNLIQALTRDFGFKTIIDVGALYLYERYRYLIPLLPSAWYFLLEDPQQSLDQTVNISNLFSTIDMPRVVARILNGDVNEATVNELQGVIELAIKARSDLVNMQNATDRKTMLHRSVEANSIPVIKLLLKYNALTNIKERYGNTPLHYAQTSQAAHLLLSHGARFDNVNNNGQMPLHVAVMANNLDVVRTLLEYGADPNSLIVTPTRISRALNHAAAGSAMEKLLREYGARKWGERKLATPSKRQLDIRTKAVKKLFDN